MRLSFVRSLVVLAECGSFTEAARRLQVSQSTVSDHIQKLERMFGMPLIERRGSASVPTARGRTILPYARALLRISERMMIAARGSSLRIGCSGNIASYYLAEDLGRAADAMAAPFDWTVDVGTNPEIADRVLHGEIDIAAMEWPDPRPELAVRPWRVEPLVVIVRPDHPLAGATSVSVDDVLSLELIGGEPGSGTGRVLRDAFGGRMSDLKVVRSLPSTEAVKSAVRAGIGASIVLRKAVESDLETGRLRGLDIDGVRLEKRFHVAIRSDMPADALCARLADFLSETATGRGP